MSAVPRTPDRNPSPLRCGKRAKADEESPIVQLPADALALIFAYAPFSARLRAIGATCKRWRTVVLRATTVLPFSGSNLHRALSMFPSLTDLTISKRCGFAQLPTTLRRLSLGGECLTYVGLANTDSMLPQLPALTYLAVEGLGTCTKHIMDFISRHSSQLTSLALEAHRLACDTLPLLSFPCLTELSVRRAQVLGADCFQCFLSQCPKLTALRVHASDESSLRSVPTQLLSATVELRLDSVHFHVDLVQLIAALPKLSMLQTVVMTPHKLPRSVCKLLTQIHPTALHAIAGSGDPGLPNLRMLTVLVNEGAQFTEKARKFLSWFPHLTKLELGSETELWYASKALPLMRFFVCECRSLRIASLYLARESSDDPHYSEIGAFLEEAQQRGLERMELRTARPRFFDAYVSKITNSGWMQVVLESLLTPPSESEYWNHDPEAWRV